jgi:hypothetical protein
MKARQPGGLISIWSTTGMLCTRAGNVLVVSSAYRRKTGSFVPRPHRQPDGSRVARGDARAPRRRDPDARQVPGQQAHVRGCVEPGPRRAKENPARVVDRPSPRAHRSRGCSHLRRYRGLHHSRHARRHLAQRQLSRSHRSPQAAVICRSVSCCGAPAKPSASAAGAACRVTRASPRRTRRFNQILSARNNLAARQGGYDRQRQESTCRGSHSPTAPPEENTVAPRRQT